MNNTPKHRPEPGRRMRDMEKGYRVFDSRNNSTLFEGTEWECMDFILKNYPGEDFVHVLIGKDEF